MFLPLYPAVAVAAGRLLHLGHGDTVEVTLDGVLQGRGSHGELDGALAVLAVEQGV